MKKNILIGMLAIVGVIGVAISFVNTGGDEKNAADAPATDPFNATFTIEGTGICLLNGRFEREAAPGSAMKIKTFVFGKPAYGDIDGDGDEDAAMVMGILILKKDNPTGLLECDDALEVPVFFK